MSASRPVACSGHAVQGTDLHLVIFPPPAPPTPVPMPLPFNGKIIGTAPLVVNGRAVALHNDLVIGEVHQPPPGTTFAPQYLTNNGTLIASQTSLIVAGRAVVAKGDLAATCHFSGPSPTSTVIEGDASLVIP